MNYKFLFQEELENAFIDTDLSIGDVMRAITANKYTDVEITNPSKLQEISDKLWYQIIKTAIEYEKED